MKKKQRFEEMNFREIEKLDKDKTLIIIPYSPLETHGPHLPIGTDIIITLEICRELIKKLRRRKRSILPLLYPAQPFGYCGYSIDAPGTISVDIRAFGRVVYDTLKYLAKQNFRYIMLLTFHMDPFYIKSIHKSIKKIEKKYPTVKIAEPISKFQNIRENINHAGEKETSLMLYLYPYLVDKIYKNLRKVELNFSFLKFRKTLKELGVEDVYLGNPSEASMELGRKLFREIVDFCVASAIELFEGRYRNEPPEYLKFLPLFLQRK